MTKRKAKSKPKRLSKPPVLIAIKIPLDELLDLKGCAKHYAQGNLSAWLRHAGLRYRPKRGEVIKTVTMPGAKKKR